MNFIWLLFLCYDIIVATILRAPPEYLNSQR